MKKSSMLINSQQQKKKESKRKGRKSKEDGRIGTVHVASPIRLQVLLARLLASGCNSLQRTWKASCGMEGTVLYRRYCTEEPGPDLRKSGSGGGCKLQQPNLFRPPTAVAETSSTHRRHTHKSGAETATPRPSRTPRTPGHLSAPLPHLGNCNLCVLFLSVPICKPPTHPPAAPPRLPLGPRRAVSHRLSVHRPSTESPGEEASMTCMTRRGRRMGRPWPVMPCHGPGFRFPIPPTHDDRND